MAKSDNRKKARKEAASRKSPGGKRGKEVSSSSSSDYTYDSSSESSEGKHRKRCRSARRRYSRSRSKDASGGTQSPEGHQKRPRQRSRSRSGRCEHQGHQGAWSGPANQLEEHGRGGGKGPPHPSKAEDFREDYSNKGFYRSDGESTSFQDFRSGSRTAARKDPPAGAVEWLEKQGRRQNFHKFDNHWNLPYGWPSSYLVDGKIICPPRADAEARDLFAGAKGLIFNFLGRNYKFVGQNQKTPLKQHWEPFPFHRKGYTPKGKGGKEPDQRPRRLEGSLAEDQTAGPTRVGAAGGWFT